MINTIRYVPQWKTDGQAFLGNAAQEVTPYQSEGKLSNELSNDGLEAV